VALQPERLAELDIGLSENDPSAQLYVILVSLIIPASYDGAGLATLIFIEMGLGQMYRRFLKTSK
jgi:hypothetical protein